MLISKELVPPSLSFEGVESYFSSSQMLWLKHNVFWTLVQWVLCYVVLSEMLPMSKLSVENSSFGAHLLLPTVTCTPQRQSAESCILKLPGGGQWARLLHCNSKLSEQTKPQGSMVKSVGFCLILPKNTIASTICCFLSFRSPSNYSHANLYQQKLPFL